LEEDSDGSPYGIAARMAVDTDAPLTIVPETDAAWQRLAASTPVAAQLAGSARLGHYPSA
jgi:hypothetical protein